LQIRLIWQSGSGENIEAGGRMQNGATIVSGNRGRPVIEKSIAVC
jgi:hypothetical protein